MYAAGANAVTGLQEDRIPVGRRTGVQRAWRVPQNCVISKRLLRSHSHWGTSAQKPSRGTGPAKAGRTSCVPNPGSTRCARREATLRLRAETGGDPGAEPRAGLAHPAGPQKPGRAAREERELGGTRGPRRAWEGRWVRRNRDTSFEAQVRVPETAGGQSAEAGKCRAGRSPGLRCRGGGRRSG